VTLRGDEPADVDGKALAEALAAGHCEVWTGVTATMGELISDQLLSLVTVPDVCRLSASREAVDRGLVAPYGTSGSLALASGGSLAYRTKMRPAGSDRTVWEFGVYGHGPQGPELAGRLADQIRTWDRERRGGSGPVLTVHPAGTPADQMPGGCLIRKCHTAVVLSGNGGAPHLHRPAPAGTTVHRYLGQGADSPDGAGQPGLGSPEDPG
jgi:protein-L-isoaspartate(D-aspartate) O-methyltransferase